MESHPREPIYSVEILFYPQISVRDLMQAIERIGPVDKVEVISGYDLATAKVAYRDPDHAKEARQWGLIAQTQPANGMIENATQTEDVSIRTGKLDPYNNNKETTHALLLGPSEPFEPIYAEEAPNRLFCIIPFKGPMVDRENKFFLHFTQFGRLNYYQVIKDKKGQPSTGYLCYFSAEDATKALERCHPDYRAVRAQPRRMYSWDQGKSIYERLNYHSECGALVERSIYGLHVSTCKKLKTWKNQLSNLLSEPKPSVFSREGRYHTPRELRVITPTSTNQKCGRPNPTG